MTNKPILEIELKGRRYAFGALDDIDKWITQERDQQVWFQQVGEFGPEFTTLRETFRSGIAAAAKRLREWRAEPDDENRGVALQQQLISTFANKKLVLHDDATARIASRVAEQLGPAAAAGAYAALTETPCTTTFDTVRGILAASLIRDGITPQSPELVSKTLEELSAAADLAARQRSGGWKTLSDEAKTALTENRSSTSSAVRETQKRTSELLETLHREAFSVIESIKATEASYREQMRLQAPVDYWEAKATTHRSAIKSSRRNIILYAILGGIVLLVALVALAMLAGDSAAGGKTAGDAAAIYLKFAAVGAIATTILFWAGRVLLRIYLSDRHLLTDAEERIAMIKTYLALSNEAKVEAAERALVLAPIFRSAADGIVKDEGLDATLAGIIAKAIDIRGRG